MPDTGLAGQRRPAAQYLRMSTEHQNYSIGHQEAALAAYADAFGLEIIRTYCDAGISGLHLEQRGALKALLSDVMDGQRDFEVILTYDVSRWGRFQDPDESAHYEFLCKMAGVRVEYCAEPFTNDGSLHSTLVKHVKRAMAAEYSRELSVKVSAAQRRLAGLGFWQGGAPGYALRRQSLRQNGARGPVLDAGERAGIAGDRVLLVLGPVSEQRVVRRIFRMYLGKHMSRADIARVLNDEGVAAEGNARWTSRRVHQVLSNSKYAGRPAFGKTVARLNSPRSNKPESTWVQVEGALPAIVSLKVIAAARKRLRTRYHAVSDADMIAGLQRLLAQKGKLTAKLIVAAEGLPCPCVYRRRFGSLLNAFALVGYAPCGRARHAGSVSRKGQRGGRKPGWASAMTDEEMIEDLKRVYAQAGRLSIAVIDSAKNTPGSAQYRIRFGMEKAYALAGYVPTRKQVIAMHPQTNPRRRWLGDQVRPQPAGVLRA